MPDISQKLRVYARESGVRLDIVEKDYALSYLLAAIAETLVRKMGVFNPVPSNQGIWQDSGASWRNYPVDRIVEDPFFKPSDQSYFIQLCDFTAYALLRRENPLASKTKYGLHESFNRLGPILVREARPRDPDGIIRP